MHILLTNDDGIYAEGIYALYLQLKKLGKVTVVAPDSERSSVGHAITLAHPIWHKKVKRKGLDFGTGVSGTPADCVKFAVGVLLKHKPDIVVSGINLGPNDGCSVFYSGTVAGAREGALMGIPSLAVSLATFVDPDFTYSAKIGAKMTKMIMEEKMPKGTFLNVNVPNKKASEIKGIRLTRQGLVPIHEVFRKRKDPGCREYHWMTGRIPVTKKDNSTDSNALCNNYVTVTPIQSDQTDHSFLEKMDHWKM
ncbi:MAG: 5'/3'-nucleotidase SurE, partial [Candidatus Omnitrophica bacterium]|nr:5'/3'-nucleotidase SurE [Candidatus Omnitrophota bacterium]